MSKYLADSRKRLAKMGPFYRVGEWERTSIGHSSPVVFFDRKIDKVKYGFIRNPHTVRYGLRIVATYAGNEAWWFLSSDVAGRDIMALMRELRETGTLAYPVINLDDLTFDA